ncbi:hypothetical protein M413DRAFT_441934 [Hebeloma cylindrosporum]|uniref:Ribonuclease H2 subunit B n=1 Tax=Hebeloma cylindrosporum TaxID=76867 RepID=A0A0C2YW92_HEBCY|nr:hypothetical protein M413DRAFT_441934 [Hebeloma cylindrosporum h7]
MTLHFSLLPTDIIEFLSMSIDGSASQWPESKVALNLLRLPHPRTGFPCLFLPLEKLPSTLNQSNILLEIQAVSPPEERSWIVGEECIADGKLLMMTPVDPAFLLIRILQATQPVDGSTSQFRTADDLIGEAAKHISSSSESENNPALQLEDIIEFFSLACTTNALTRLCDMKEISSEIAVYRYSQSKFLEYLRTKVAHLQKCSAFDESQTLTRGLAKEGLMEDGKEELLNLARTHACCDLVAQYLPSDIRDVLLNSYDFSKLQNHIEANKEQIISNLAAAPKTKAKAEGKSTAADKKRKAGKPSQGVEKLKKANTTGMAKLSSFFGKA